MTEPNPCKHFRCIVCDDSVYCCRCCGLEHEPERDKIIEIELTDEVSTTEHGDVT